jgi:hypothetical protein
VNGENLTNATHRRAVNLLKNAGNDILMFVVKADMLKASKQASAVPQLFSFFFQAFVHLQLSNNAAVFTRGICEKIFAARLESLIRAN